MTSASISPLLGVADTATMERQLRTGSKETDAQATAAQFEAILVRQLLGESLKPMLGADSGAKTPGSDVYQYLVTDVVAQSVAQGGGLGIAKMLVAQLSPKGTGADPAEVSS